MPITLPAFLTRPQITAQVRTADLPANFAFSQWFPVDGVDADEFESLVILDQMHLAPFVAIDAESPSMPDDIIGSSKWQVAYIRFKKRFKESDLRIFHEPGVTDPNTMTAISARAAESKMRRYIDLLSVSIDARMEWMFANAINGNIAYNDQNVQYTIAFDGAFIGGNRFVPGTLWSDPSADIMTDLSNWIEQLSDEANHDSWILVGSRNALGAMARNDQVLAAYAAGTNNPAFGSFGSLNPISDPAATGFNAPAASTLSPALSILGIDGVMSYNTRYSTRSGGAFAQTRNRVRFTDNRDIWLLPNGMPLGRMATAPAGPNNYQTGKFGWSEERQDPFVVEVGAGMYTWIDFPGTQWNKLAQARVL